MYSKSYGPPLTAVFRNAILMPRLKNERGRGAAMVKNLAIVSLSSGMLGELSVKHELELGLRRLAAYGLNVSFTPHALDGLQSLAAHPEHRAADLIAAFQDDAVDMILCAIGGDDTYRLLPYLFGRDQLKKAIKKKKIFLGFSDTTVNHFMLHKLGLPSFYGQAFLPDICELSEELLPYTRRYFEELIRTGSIARIEPSPVWYEERTDFGPDQLGRPLPVHKNGGFELLQGPSVFSGEILGGCIDTIYDMFYGERYSDSARLCQAYALFPPLQDWRGKLLLLETSEDRPAPEKYAKALRALKDFGLFEVINGILIGKPQNEIHADAYKKALVAAVDNPALPIVCNLSIGHAAPRCILPLGVLATVDIAAQCIRFSP